MASINANYECNHDSTLNTKPLLENDDRNVVICARSWEHQQIGGSGILDQYNKSLNMESVDNSKSGGLTKKQKILRLIYTVLLCYLLFVFGMQVSGMGPALVDLSHIYDENLDKMTIISSLYSVGYCLGAFSATLFRWINRQLSGAILLTIGSAAFASFPHVPSVYYAYGLNLFVGLSHGMLDTSQNVWLMEMWYENPNPIMQLSQASYGLGTIVAPLLERPFVKGDEDDDENDKTLITGLINKSSNSSSITPEERRQNLMIPFLLLSGLMWLGVAVQFIMYFFHRYQAPPEEVLKLSRDAKENETQTKLFERENAPKILIVILAAFNLGAYVCVEVSYFGFSATFSQKIPLKVSAPDAASIQSALAAAFTIGRVCNFFIAMKLKPRQLLYIHYSLLILSLIALLFSGESLVVLWIANITIGYGFAAMWSSILTFMENYLIINDTIGGILVSCGGALGAIVAYLIGLKIESVPMSLIYIDLGLVLVSVTLHIIIRLIIRSQRSKLV